MGLPPKAIEELRRIHRKEFNRELSEADAWAMGYRLVTLFDILSRPPGTSGPTSPQ